MRCNAIRCNAIIGNEVEEESCDDDERASALVFPKKKTQERKREKTLDVYRHNIMLLNSNRMNGTQHKADGTVITHLPIK
jgi:hypothetical protein